MELTYPHNQRRNTQTLQNFKSAWWLPKNQFGSGKIWKNIAIVFAAHAIRTKSAPSSTMCWVGRFCWSVNAAVAIQACALQTRAAPLETSVLHRAMVRP